jgi:hypothetical protein
VAQSTLFFPPLKYTQRLKTHCLQKWSQCYIFINVCFCYF